MHEGTVSAELGIGGWPSIAESVMVERDLALAEYEGRSLHLMHLSAHESVELCAALRRTGSRQPPRSRRTTSFSRTRPCAPSTRT